MAQQSSVQPIFILQEGTQRSSGRDAQKSNIMAAKAIAETVRTTLGPKGMDKMLVSSIGDIVITNDGVTILQEMQIEHPAAKMLVEIAKTQENEVGDGTTTVVVLAGELLKQAEKLIEDNVHPTVIARGYRLAAEKAQEILQNTKRYAKYTAGSYLDISLSSYLSILEKGYDIKDNIFGKKNTELYKSSWESVRDYTPGYRVREKLRETMDTKPGMLYLQSNLISTIPFVSVGMPVAELARLGIESLNSPILAYSWAECPPSRLSAL